MPNQYEAILVTGAGGAVGQFAVDECIETSAIVIATDLPGRIPQRFIDHPGIAVLEADLTTPEGFKELREVAGDFGIEAIINTAAVVDIAQPWEVVSPVNVHLVSDLFELGVVLLVDHFVHISSASIYADQEDDEVFIREHDPVLGSSPYEWSKISSEQILQALVATQSRMKVTVLRPSLIYGPRCRFLGAALASIPVLLEKISQVVFGFYGGPRTNWVHCEDVARACVHCMQREDPEDYRVFNVCNTEAPGFGEVITEHIEAYGLVSMTEIPLPSPAMLRMLKPLLESELLFDKVLNPTLDALWSLFGEPSSQILVKVDKEAVPYAFKHTLFSNAALRSTGFDFKWSLPKGIRNTLDWYKRYDWI